MMSNQQLELLKKLDANFGYLHKEANVTDWGEAVKDPFDVEIRPRWIH